MMKVWLVFVGKEVKHVCKTPSSATERLVFLKKSGLDAWCIEYTVEE